MASLRPRPDQRRDPVQRGGPLAFVIALHLVFFHVLQSGLQHAATVQTPPREIMVTLITPEPPKAEPSRPAPPPPPQPAPVKAAPPKPHKRPAHPAARPMPQPAASPAPSPQKPVVVPPAEPATASVPVTTPAPAMPSAPPAPAAPPTPKLVSNGVECPQLPQPDYPALSRRMGEEGKVMLRILLTETGRVGHVDIQKSSGFTRLDEAARQAMLHARCKPYLDNGKPVPVYAIQPITFQLDS